MVFLRSYDPPAAYEVVGMTTEGCRDPGTMVESRGVFTQWEGALHFASHLENARINTWWKGRVVTVDNASEVWAEVGDASPVSYKVLAHEDDEDSGVSKIVRREFSNRLEALNYASAFEDAEVTTWRDGRAILTEDAIDIVEALVKSDAELISE